MTRAGAVSLVDARAPLNFEANRGQAADWVNFISRGRDCTLLLGRTEAVLGLRGATVRLQLVNANPDAPVSGVGELPLKINSYIGNDPARWQTGVPTFGKVAYREVYPGVDLVFYGNQRQLEYDFVLAPGARPETIMLALEGAEDWQIDTDGNLAVCAGGQHVQLKRPEIYQLIDGVRRPVAGAFERRGERLVGFVVGAYDAQRPLVIDPTFVFSTFLGGSGDESGMIYGTTAGNYYVIGLTSSMDLLQKPPVAQSGYGGGTNDIFVAKLNASGVLQFCTYLGGNGKETVTSFVDSNENVYVAGTTTATNFPMSNAYQGTYGGGSNDAFLVRLNASGVLQFSTYLGGSGTETASLDVDASGTAYLSGQTTSSASLPTHSAYQGSYGGGAHDMYVAKFNASGVNQFCTYLGGSGDESGTMVLDAGGYPIVIGNTSSTNFPMQNAVRGTYGGGTNDVYVTRLTPAGNAVVFSTYLGGTGTDNTTGRALDSAGNIFVIGTTTSTNYPLANAVQSVYRGAGTLTQVGDVFVTKLTPAGALVYSTYLGGNDNDSGSLALDPAGNAVINGSTMSSNFPTFNASQPAYGGCPNPFLTYGDVFLTKLSTNGQFIFSTYLGGSGSEVGYTLWVTNNAIYVGGMTGSTNFPVLNAVQSTFGGPNVVGGMGDMFVAKYNGNGVKQFCTYLGGASNELGMCWYDRLTDSVIVSGNTPSRDYPMNNASQSSYGGGTNDTFITKLNSSGQFVFSTYLGGEGNDTGFAFPGVGGEIYAFGQTTSLLFPKLNPVQNTYGGGAHDAFVTKLTSTGTVVYSTYLGGSGDEKNVLIFPGINQVLVFGLTTSVNFPVTNALQSAYGGGDDVFLSLLTEGPAPCSYSITTSVSPPGAGSTGGGGSVPCGSNTTVTATATGCFRFVNWTENGTQVSTSSNYTFTATANRTLVANFTGTNYTINTSASPVGGGSITGGGTVACGSNVTLVATPTSCYDFSNWTENSVVVSTNASYSFTATANRTLEANFVAQSFTFTVTVSPVGWGYANRTSGTRPCGTVVPMIATPNACYHFVNWTVNGVIVSTSATYSAVITNNDTYVANFGAGGNGTVTTAVNPPGTGTTSGGGAVPCSTTTSVSATPTGCYTFVSWTENGAVVSTAATYNFTVVSNHTLTANFGPGTVAIATSANPPAGGIITGGGSATCGGNVALQATANAGYTFVNWTDGATVVSTSPNYNFTATGNRTLVANFSAGLAIVTGSPLPAGVVGLSYTQLFQAVNGTLPYKWYVIGELPRGVTLNATSGLLAGKPTAAGTNSFRIRVSDAAHQSATNTFSVVIRDVFGPLAGTYNGLILPTNAPTFGSSGAIKIVLTKTGAFAANVSLGGVTGSFRGQFDPAGNATNTATKPAAQFVLHLDVTGATGEITGRATGSGFVAAVLADKAAFSGSKPCPVAGKYNCLFESTTNLVTVPQGDGYATLTVAASGNGALAGTLADGTAISCTMPVSAQKTWPLYKLLYASKGAAIGWVSFTPSNVVAVVDWFKPPVTSGRYAVGFNTAFDLTGTRLAPPAGVGNWHLTLAAGELPSNMVWAVTVSGTGTATLPPADAYKLKLKVTPATGKFTGSFVHPGNNKVTPFTGLFLQAPENDAGGFFLGPTTSGAVTLEP